MSIGLIIMLILTVFYVVLVALQLLGKINRDNISLYGPFIMIKTQRGKKAIDWIAKKRDFWKAYGTISIGVVYTAMILMFLLLLYQATLVHRIPANKAPSPQMMIGLPGLNPLIPIWYGILGLAVAMIVHEFAHGILTRVADTEVKNLGLLYLIVPMGAFVEPDEEAVEKLPRSKRIRLFAVGPATNIFVAFLCVFLFAWGFIAALEPEQDGMIVLNVTDDLPADKAGLEEGMVITAVNGTIIEEADDFSDFLEDSVAGQVINITVYDDGEIRTYENITLDDRYDHTELGEDRGKGYLGISAPVTVGGLRDVLVHPFRNRDLGGAMGVTLFYISLPFFRLSPFPDPIVDLYTISGPLGALPEPVFWITANCLYWIFWLNLMVGITNSLPAVPLDGGFIFRDTLDKLIGKVKQDSSREQRDEYVGKITLYLAYFILVLILLPIFVPRILGWIGW
jgi:membrane-associated protease RseP (regulator of RpoE activity)